MQGQMTLQEWMYREHVAVQAFAKRIGVSRATVYNWLRGGQPTLAHAQRVEQETYGRVPVRIWAQEHRQ